MHRHLKEALAEKIFSNIKKMFDDYHKTSGLYVEWEAQITLNGECFYDFDSGFKVRK